MEAEGTQKEQTHVQWFQCPGCDCIVTGQVLGTGPSEANRQATSSTHCCHNCERGWPHDSFWCAGVSGKIFREVTLPQRDPSRPPERAHYLLHMPDPSLAGTGPAPALLWLHGALTFLYPETLPNDLSSFLNVNPKAREFIVVAPLAARGETLAVESEWRQKKDRFDNDIPYVDRFDEERTWSCFVAALQQLGPRQVDFERLSVTGLSMGSQAAWDILTRYGSYLAAAAPIAASCAWRGDAWEQQATIFGELKDLPIRTFAMAVDTNGYEWKDLRWIGQERGEEWDPILTTLQIEPGVEAHVHSWGSLLQLALVHGGKDCHNCWDMVYQREDLFGLFGWLASERNPRGFSLSR